MEVTEVQIKRLINKKELKAYASVKIDDSLVLNDLKIIKNKDGKLGVFFPQSDYNKKRKNIEKTIKTK